LNWSTGASPAKSSTELAPLLGWKFLRARTESFFGLEKGQAIGKWFNMLEMVWVPAGKFLCIHQ